MLIRSYPKKLFDKMVDTKEYGPNDSFISIGYTFPVYDTGLWDDDPRIPEEGRFLRILFDDILMDFGQCKAMTETQAHEILTFIEEHTGGTIHVHCQMGQSRSVAVADSLAKLFRSRGADIETDHLNSIIHPNKLVMHIFDKLIETLRNGTSEPGL